MDSSDSPAVSAQAELPTLQPEFAAPLAPLKIGRCPIKSENIDPLTLEPTLCPMPKLDLINPPVFGDQFKLKPYPITKEDEPLDRNTRFTFKLDAPPSQPALDLRLRFDKATSFDLNFNGQPVEMSLNPRKCNSKARAGLCFRVGF